MSSTRFPLVSDASVLQLIIEKIDTLTALQMLCRVCKYTNSVLNTNPCDQQWMVIAKKTCGAQYWSDKTLPQQPHTDNQRYTAMLRLCPWLSVPAPIKLKMEEKFEESTLAHTYFFNPSKNPVQIGKHLRIQKSDYHGTDYLESYHAVLTNPRPFGRKFEIPVDHKFETINMRACEEEYLDSVRKMQIPSIFKEGREFTRVVMIHDGAIAAQLERPLVNEQTHHPAAILLIFATKPELRFIRYVPKPVELIGSHSFCFGLGEMWVSGTEYMDEESKLLYFGPRRDKRVHINPLLSRAIPAFWAAAVGDIDAATEILTSFNLPLTAACPITGCTILHYAIRANNLHAVRRLVLEFQMLPNSPNCKTYPPINTAARFGFEDIVDFLAEQGATGNKWMSGGWEYPREKDKLKMGIA